MPNALEKVFSRAASEKPEDKSKMLYTSGNSDNPVKPVTGRPSAALEEAIRLMREEGYSAHAAAKKVGIALSTIYRSNLYRELTGKPRWTPPKKEDKP